MIEIHKEEISLKDELKRYSNQGLENFEKALAKEMQGVMPNDANYDRLLEQYNAILDELIDRGLVKMPF